MSSTAQRSPGQPFTSSDFIELLKNQGIQISTDGKGCWRDNIFVERLWRTITPNNAFQPT